MLICFECLCRVVQEHDDIWRDKIRAKRFEAFNREWLQLIAQSGGVGGHGHGAMHPHDGGLGAGLGMHQGTGQYDGSLGDSMDDSADSLGGRGGRGGAGVGGHGYPYGGGHDDMGNSQDLEHYRHEQSRDGESALEDSEDLSQR